MDLKLSGRKVLVTGGTKGIGRAIVEAFLAEGAHVAFCARNGDEVAAAAKQLGESGAVAHGFTADVGDAAAVSDFVEQAAAALGGLDVAVSNVSALAIPDTEENWEASLRVDLLGTVRLYKAALAHIENSDAGALVTVSSVSGRETDFAAGPYGTVKAALIAYTAGLAFQLAPRNIRANTVSPGNTFFEAGVWDQIKHGNAELYDFALSLNPTGRMGSPQEMAAAVVFLASPVSSFTMGTNLVVDGALTRGVQY